RSAPAEKAERRPARAAKAAADTAPARGTGAPAKKAAPRPANGSKKKAAAEAQGEQLAMMSREELYQLAQDINVPGRSKMNRDQLAEAVASARAARRAS
ncbi:MAG TPA: Rho termination factor N-terminal domain-containing protein, partial [Acidimicrobiales bacterium]|nr:Rho termination factor N-terminal domain-containing protein [Acidimicrobiales bacterium]